MLSNTTCRNKSTNILNDLGQVGSDPNSNTGSDSQLSTSPELLIQARVDNLSLLWDKTGSCDFVGAIDRFLGVKFDWVNPVARKIGVLWHRNYISPSGCLYSERDGFRGRIHCRLSISGKVCAATSNSKLRGFALWCKANLRGLNCSRIDLAVDDFSKALDYGQITQALDEKNHSGFNVGDSVKNYGTKHGGWTIYLGKRTSEKFVRVYDKFAESKGQIDSVRWEAEYKATLANHVFNLYLSECPQGESEMQSWIVKVAISGVTFVSKVSKNIKRCPLLGWWEDWLNYLLVTPFKISVLRTQSSILKKMEWVRKSVSKSLSLIRDAVGNIAFQTYLEGILAEGRQRYTNFDGLILDEFTKCIENNWVFGGKINLT